MSLSLIHILVKQRLQIRLAGKWHITSRAVLVNELETIDWSGIIDRITYGGELLCEYLTRCDWRKDFAVKNPRHVVREEALHNGFVQHWLFVNQQVSYLAIGYFVAFVSHVIVAHPMEFVYLKEMVSDFGCVLKNAIEDGFTIYVRASMIWIWR